MLLNPSEIRRQITEAREKYRPVQVRCILVAEAPPREADQFFFYYSDVKRADHLFLGVMEALYPDEKQNYLLAGRNSQLKEQLLRRFQADGFYLLDILDVPKRTNQDLKKAVPDLIKRLRTVAAATTPIILIKISTYDIAAHRIRQAGFNNVIPAPIAFPGNAQQSRFQIEFKEALRLADLGVH